MGKLTKSLAEYPASKAQKPVTGTVSTVTGWGGQPGMSYLVDAARGGLVAYGTVYNNQVQRQDTRPADEDNSVKIMEHRYGAEAGGVWGEAMTLPATSALTYMNIRVWAPRACSRRLPLGDGEECGQECA